MNILRNLVRDRQSVSAWTNQMFPLQDIKGTYELSLPFVSRLVGSRVWILSGNKLEQVK